MTIKHVLRLVALPVAGLSLGGCALSPSIPVLGASFPDWLFCLVGGIAGTVVVHLALGRLGRRNALAPLPVSYVALSGLFSMAAWLIFFSH